MLSKALLLPFSFTSLHFTSIFSLSKPFKFTSEVKKKWGNTSCGVVWRKSCEGSPSLHFTSIYNIPTIKSSRSSHASASDETDQAVFRRSARTCRYIHLGERKPAPSEWKHIFKIWEPNKLLSPHPANRTIEALPSWPNWPTWRFKSWRSSFSWIATQISHVHEGNARAGGRAH